MVVQKEKEHVLQALTDSEISFTINFAQSCVCGCSHILFCLGIKDLAHIGLDLFCVVTENIRTSNSENPTFEL